MSLLAVVGVGAMVAAALYVLGSSSGDGSMVVAVANRDGSFDLHVLDMGDDLDRDNRFLTEVEMSSGIVRRVEEPDLYYAGYASAVLSSGRWTVVYHDSEAEEYRIASMTADGESLDLAETDGYWDGINLNLDGSLEMVSRLDTSARCYWSDGKANTDRVATGDECWWLESGVAAARSFGSSSVEYEVIVGESAEYQLDIDVDEYLDGAVTPDGRYAAIALGEARDGGGDVQFEFYDLASDRVVHGSDDYAEVWRVSALGQTGSRASAFVVDDEGVSSILIFGPSLVQPIEVRGGQAAALAPQGDHAIVHTRDGDELGLLSVDLNTFEERVLSEADDHLQYGFLPDGSLLIVAGDGELSHATVSGTTADLDRVRVGETLQSMSVWALDGDEVVLRVTGWDGTDNVESLYYVDTGSGAVSGIIEGWVGLGGVAIDPAGGHVVFSGDERGSGQRSLWSARIDGSAEPTELDDDADAYFGLSFRGTEVYYTADLGDDPDDYEIRRVSLSSGDRPETLYEGARLIAVGWAEPSKWTR